MAILNAEEARFHHKEMHPMVNDHHSKIFKIAMEALADMNEVRYTNNDEENCDNYIVQAGIITILNNIMNRGDVSLTGDFENQGTGSLRCLRPRHPVLE